MLPGWISANPVDLIHQFVSYIGGQDAVTKASKQALSDWMTKEHAAVCVDCRDLKSWKNSA